MVYIEYFSCICYRARALYHFILCFMSCPHVVCASCAVVFIDFGASLFACSTQGTSPYTHTPHTHSRQASTHMCCVCVLDFAIYALIFICHIVLFARDLWRQLETISPPLRIWPKHRSVEGGSVRVGVGLMTTIGRHTYILCSHFPCGAGLSVSIYFFCVFSCICYLSPLSLSLSLLALCCCLIADPGLWYS